MFSGNDFGLRTLVIALGSIAALAALLVFVAGVLIGHFWWR